ncbi:MAG: glycosyltransferase family 4 protein [Thermomicrobiales bacterium]
MTASIPRILLVTGEPVGPLMGEPATRAWELATVLAREFRTTLAAPAPVPPDAPGFFIAALPPASEGYAALTELIRAHDVIIAQALPIAALPAEEMASKYLVVDLCRPWMIEHLEASLAREAAGEERWLARDLIAINGLLATGDFFICPGETQRAFWLGALAHIGRLTETIYRRAPDGRALIDVVPYGIPALPPPKQAKALKGVLPGIGPTDFVALWAGGFRHGLDPLALVHATARLRDADYPIRTVMLDTSPAATPEDTPLPTSLLDAVRARSDELGLTDTHVFFLDGFVPNAARAEYLLEGDVGVTLQQPSLEARFAFRTPVLDALWAGIVPVVSDGDTMADLLRSYDAGRTVPPGDDAALAVTLANLIDNPYERRLLAARGHTLGQSYTWETVARPLVAFCRQPMKGERVPGFIAADLQERVNELERTLFQTSTYAERLERQLAARGGPDLTGTPANRGIGSRFRRTMNDFLHGRSDPRGEKPPEEQRPGEPENVVVQ